LPGKIGVEAEVEGLSLIVIDGSEAGRGLTPERRGVVGQSPGNRHASIVKTPASEGRRYKRRMECAKLAVEGKKAEGAFLDLAGW
jgi:hypothetical protein